MNTVCEFFTFFLRMTEIFFIAQEIHTCILTCTRTRAQGTSDGRVVVHMHARARYIR